MLNKNEYPSATNWRLIARETRSMYHHLRERKTKVNYYALPLLGLAPLIDMSNKTLASEIVEVSNYLAEFKDVFGFWKCLKANRTLIAIALCYSYYFGQINQSSSMTNQLLLKIMMASIITKKVKMKQQWLQRSDASIMAIDGTFIHYLTDELSSILKVGGFKSQPIKQFRIHL